MTQLKGQLQHFFCLLLILASPVADASSLVSQRADFLAAEQARAAGDIGTYEQLKQGLGDYPLKLYLEFAEIRSDLDNASEDTLAEFINAHGDTAPGQRLRAYYLDKLANKGRWKTFLEYYDPDEQSISLRCHHLNALIQTGRQAETHAAVEEIWLSHGSRPAACDPVFRSWYKRGVLDRALVWKRIDKAILHGNPGLAKALRNYLGSSDHKWLERWLELRTKPEKALRSLSGSHFLKGTMMGYGLGRLAEKDLQQALQMHASLRGEVPSQQVCDMEDRFSSYLYRMDGNETYAIFSGMHSCPDHPEMHEARIRAALLRLRWEDVSDWYDSSPATVREKQEWKYWKARALAETGERKAAKALYRDIIDDRSFYAFLASDQLGKRYYWNHRKASRATGNLKEIEKHPAMLRIQELYRLGRDLDGRREWNYLTRSLDQDSLIAAAVLLDDWGIHDRAIFTISKAAYWDDLELRFPTRHEKLVTEQARKRNIDRNWAFAILRQESAFMQDAESGAGALGLMQLMPRTAKLVASQDGRSKPSRSELLQPETNIALGTGYLGMMMERFGNLTLATAAYNAGPNRVDQWLYDKELPADIWVELIPFKETRGYVRRVMTYAAIYDRLLGGNKQRISDRLGTIERRYQLKNGSTTSA